MVQDLQEGHFPPPHLYWYLDGFTVLAEFVLRERTKRSHSSCCGKVGVKEASYAEVCHGLLPIVPPAGRSRSSSLSVASALSWSISSTNSSIFAGGDRRHTDILVSDAEERRVLGQETLQTSLRKVHNKGKG